MYSLIATWLMLTLAAGIPPLTDEQRTLLDSADDGARSTDQAALYGLLGNAVDWPTDTEAGAAIPDYAAIRDNPAAFRGQLFLIEGVFNGKPRSQPDVALHVSRPGPWSGNLQSWAVVVDRAAREVVLVYLVNPSTPADRPPPAGTQVRLPARFYRSFSSPTLDAPGGEPVQFLVFVGHAPTLVEADTSSGDYLLPAVVVLTLAFGGYLLLRRKKLSAQASPLATRVRRAQKELESDGEPDEDAGPPLPSNPVDALQELSRRRDREG